MRNQTKESGRSDDVAIHGEITISGKVTIRDVEPDDLRHLTWFGALDDFRDTIQKNYRAHQQGRLRYLIADLQGFPVGQTVVAFERPADMPPDDGAAAYLYAIRVLAPLRSVGIGTALARAAEQVARERGCQRVRLTVQTVNTSALALYERLGYRAIGQVVSEWSYTDAHGRLQKINEPVFVMERAI
ncbi:MAG: GNAT family N-acetyltransferase [Chloroflexi bacterium]|nr:GNAT family N-acetyltransferase [Chloroflexota bacterium]